MDGWVVEGSRDSPTRQHANLQDSQSQGGDKVKAKAKGARFETTTLSWTSTRRLETGMKGNAAAPA